MIQKPLKVLIVVAGIVALILVVGMIGWNIVRLYSLRSSLQDVYFMEYVNGTTIYKYDVDKRKTVVVAVLEGGKYSHCKINRTENYIIGEFYYYNKNDTTFLLRYNLSDDTVEEMTGKEAEVMEERIKEAEDKLPQWSDLPEEVRDIVCNSPISWSVDGKIATFSDGDQENIYLYHADTETCERILKAGWNQTFGYKLGLDANGKYIFYKNNYNYLFDTADIKIMIYDTQTRMRRKIYEQKYTQHDFEFVQEMD